MMSRGSGPQMLMIDLHYRFGQHGDFGVASALGVVSYLLASGAAYYYLLLADGVAVSARSTLTPLRLSARRSRVNSGSAFVRSTCLPFTAIFMRRSHLFEG